MILSPGIPEVAEVEREPWLQSQLLLTILPIAAVNVVRIRSFITASQVDNL
jgi:hypothetical protein